MLLNFLKQIMLVRTLLLDFESFLCQELLKLSCGVAKNVDMHPEALINRQGGEDQLIRHALIILDISSKP